MALSPYSFPHYSYAGFAGDSLLLTRNGLVAVGTLLDQSVIAWTGSQWEEVIVRSAGKDQLLYDVTVASQLGETMEGEGNQYEETTLKVTKGYFWMDWNKPKIHPLKLADQVVYQPLWPLRYEGNKKLFDAGEDDSNAPYYISYIQSIPSVVDGEPVSSGTGDVFYIEGSTNGMICLGSTIVGAGRSPRDETINELPWRHTQSEWITAFFSPNAFMSRYAPPLTDVGDVLAKLRFNASFQGPYNTLGYVVPESSMSRLVVIEDKPFEPPVFIDEVDKNDRSFTFFNGFSILPTFIITSNEYDDDIFIPSFGTKDIEQQAAPVVLQAYEKLTATYLPNGNIRGAVAEVKLTLAGGSIYEDFTVDVTDETGKAIHSLDFESSNQTSFTWPTNFFSNEISRYPRWMQEGLYSILDGNFLTSFIQKFNFTIEHDGVEGGWPHESLLFGDLKEGKRYLLQIKKKTTPPSISSDDPIAPDRSVYPDDFDVLIGDPGEGGGEGGGGVL